MLSADSDHMAQMICGLVQNDPQFNYSEFFETSNYVPSKDEVISGHFVQGRKSSVPCGQESAKAFVANESKIVIKANFMISPFLADLVKHTRIKLTRVTI